MKPMIFIFIFTFLLTLSCCWTDQSHARDLQFSDYQQEIWNGFFDQLPNGASYYPEWSYSKSDERMEVVKCLEYSFNFFQSLQYSSETNANPENENSDFFKTYQGECKNLNPKLTFLIKSRNVKSDQYEIVFFQDKLLGKGGFKMVYPGLIVNFERDKKIRYHHVIVANFIRPNEYYYYQKKDVENFNRLGKPLKLVERYGFYDTETAVNYLSQRRYLSWKELKEKYLAKFSVKQKKSLVYDMLEGIKEIHSRNMVHGDIKEDNLFFYYDSQKERYVALIGDFDGMGPVGSRNIICTWNYLSNYNFIEHHRGRGILVKREDDLFAASIVAELIIKGHSDLLKKRIKDLTLLQPKRFEKIKKHNSKCQKLKRIGLGEFEMVRLINRLRCDSLSI